MSYIKNNEKERVEMESTIQLYLDKAELIREYTETLINKRPHIASFYLNGVAMAQEEVALNIIRYVFENLLHWNPDTALNWFGKEIIKKLKLQPYIKMITFPIELDSKVDYWYIVYKAYPNQIAMDTRSLTLRIYNQIIQKKREKFPNRFFNGLDGQFKAAICLNHAIDKHLSFNNLNEYYAFFASNEGKRFIKDVRLSKVCKEVFSDPLEFAHYALHPDQRNEFLYKFQIFCQENNYKKGGD